MGRLADGAAVFVAGVAAGELVEAEVSTASKLARGHLLRVLEPSPDRVPAPCPYLEACGGCSFMHLTTRAQESAHAAVVRDAVAHAVPDATLPDVVVHAARDPLAYRTRARFYAKADRRGVHVGYRAASSHDLAPVDACLVLDAALTPLFADLAVVLAGAHGEGDAAVARGQGGLPVVSLEWRGELPASTWAALDARVTMGLRPAGAGLCPKPPVAGHAWAGAQVILHGSSRPATFGDPRPVLQGAEGAPLIIAAGGFAQPSYHGASELARRVDELARIEPTGTTRPRHVVELFAGSGTLSVLLDAGEARPPGAQKLSPAP